MRISMTDQNFTAMRRAMVESQLRTNDVNDPVLLEVILAVPREGFLAHARKAAAYVDRSVPVDDSRALNPPLPTARLLIEAGINPGDRVLLVGAATGYAAALLARLGCSVVAVEENAALAAQAKTALSGYAGVTLVTGGLTDGHAKGAPYDIIVVDGAIEAMPDALIDQLKIG